MAFTEALKPKSGSKHLSTIINAEGKEVQAETRDDEQQKEKYKDIIDILVGAGYYRAKIKGLSEFDKVVGGMTWCIDICNMDLDVDLLFQENSTIGQKIALTEKIVAVLPKMKCPHIIEPHQIQGLDFIHIHPVIEWLVKKSIENREEMGDYLRLYAVHQFNKDYSFPHEKLDDGFISRALLNVKTVQDKYGTQRKYRRVEAQPADTISRVESTLFEYGHAPLQEDEGKEGEEMEVEIIDEVRLQQLISTMTSTSQDLQVGAGTVTSIVNKKAEEITEAVENYSTLLAEMELSGESEVKRLQEKENCLLMEKEKLEQELNSVLQKLEKISGKNNAPFNITDLSEQDQVNVKQLENMLLINEALKEQESKFREQCKIELANLQTLIKEAEEVETVNEEDDGVNELIKEVAEARIALAKTTRAVAVVHRLLDQIPSRAELSQYQRRFLELYNMVSAKHRETKQYYTLYNTFNDTNQYLLKELTLLNSIRDNYNEAMSSPNTKEQFMKQFETKVDGIKHNKVKVEQRRNDERDLRDKYKSQLQSLVEQQRLYATLLKQFTAECRLNENLVNQLKQRTYQK